MEKHFEKPIGERKMRTLHLVCNAHLDPVWLWQWEEGAAEALSTFRTAADFCEAYDGFLFNHNEALLYEYIEEYDPDLFHRIEELVARGKWHIMGGWYLQPDCNMPAGESFVRQILHGRSYFLEKFHKVAATAVNFDPFGHSRGLVQVMVKSGYHSYLFCRPQQADCSLPADDFVWIGFDGSRIAAHRSSGHYLSQRGAAAEKVKQWMDAHHGSSTGLVLWGVGNHGGGPSRADLEALELLRRETRDWEIHHSLPESYFEDLQESSPSLPEVKKSLNPFAVGCYTSQIRVKQRHRRLENQLYATEKICSGAAVQGLLPYPQEQLREAARDLLFCQFHDILPGSAIEPAEEDALRRLDHGLEILSRVKLKAFFALCSGQARAREGKIPVLAYNPHPHRVRGDFVCELQLPDQDRSGNRSAIEVFQAGRRVPSQLEKESSHLAMDWRKRIVFHARLEPSAMNRFDCRVGAPLPPETAARGIREDYLFETEEITVRINGKTGLVDCYRIGGADFLGPGAFSPVVRQDSPDPWGMTAHRFGPQIGCFELLSPEQAAELSGIPGAGLPGAGLPSVRLVEDGEIRTVVEALFGYGRSFLHQRYCLPKHGRELTVEIRVIWNEKDRMLKWTLPCPWKSPRCIRQVVFGSEELPGSGEEGVFQKWALIASEQEKLALSCINDGIYGLDFNGSTLSLSLLRSPAYSALPSAGKVEMPQDRFLPRIDQGEHRFTFWVCGGEIEERLGRVGREAAVHNEPPFLLAFHPSGSGKKVKPLIELHDPVIELTAFKQSHAGRDYILRLFEPTGKARETEIEIPAALIKRKLRLEAFEVKTYRLDEERGVLAEVNLTEENI
jgi:alpha-mannosidase